MSTDVKPGLKEAAKIAKDEVQSSNNCTRPPHFPPHCGCPA